MRLPPGSRRRIPPAWEGITLSGYCPTAPPIWLTRRLTDDSVRKVQTISDIVKWRALATYYVWGLAGLPNWIPGVEHGVTNPFASLPNCARVDRLHYPLRTTNSNGYAIIVNLWAWHFIPTASVKNRCVIYCPGHGSANDDESPYPSQAETGDWRMISTLVAAGFDVIWYAMPAYISDAPGGIDGCEPNWTADTGVTPPFPYAQNPHEWLAYFPPQNLSEGSFFRFFLTMPVLCLNYAQVLGRFTDFSATGMSGGGWTTSVLPALDTRILRWYAVAGSMPCYMRPVYAGRDTGDAEQTHPDLYRGCGYLDLYLMGTSNARHGEMIYNRADDVVFGAAEYADVEVGRVRCNGLTYDQAIADFAGEISTAATAITGGTFVASIDETAISHQNSWQTCYHVRDALLTAG